MNRFQKMVAKLVGLREQHPTSGVPGEEQDWDKFRPLTGRNVNRELSPMVQDKMVNIAFWLYDTNGMAKRMMDLQTDFILGEGVKYKAEDDEVQKVLDRFWFDHINNWPIQQHRRVLELGLFGAQCWPVTVNTENGHVTMGNLDSALIQAVKTHPDNVEFVTDVIRKKNSMDGEERVYKVIHQCPETELFEGEAFYFAVNNVTGAVRGRSDLFSIADYLDSYDKFLFNRAERSALMNVFLWDVMLKGATNEEITEFLKKQDLPKPGSMRAHNENVEYNAIVPKLEAHDASEEARLLRNHILGSFGLPGFYFGEGDKTTRATAIEMGTPTFKKFKRRQMLLKHMIEYVFRFVIDQAIKAGYISSNVNKAVQVVFPKISSRDLQILSQALSQITLSLVTAVEAGFISEDKARMIYAEQVSQLGQDVVAEEGSKSEEEDEDEDTRESKDYRGKKLDLPTKKAKLEV